MTPAPEWLLTQYCLPSTTQNAFQNHGNAFQNCGTEYVPELKLGPETANL
jgi:hypothetical protein